MKNNTYTQIYSVKSIKNNTYLGTWHEKTINKAVSGVTQYGLNFGISHPNALYFKIEISLSAYPQTSVSMKP